MIDRDKIWNECVDKTNDVSACLKLYTEIVENKKEERILKIIGDILDDEYLEKEDIIKAIKQSKEK